MSGRAANAAKFPLTTAREVVASVHEGDTGRSSCVTPWDGTTPAITGVYGQHTAVVVITGPENMYCTHASGGGSFTSYDPFAHTGLCSVTVPIGGGRMMAVAIGQTVPWVADGTLVLFPGETVIVSLAEEPADAPPLTLVVAGEAANARNLTPGEMRFTFAASETGMLLKVCATMNITAEPNRPTRRMTTSGVRVLTNSSAALSA